MITSNENWKDILGYEGLYQVSDNGKVRKVLPPDLDGTERYKRMSCSPFGANYEYRAVGLTKEHVTKLYYVHRLVAEAFIGLPGDLNPDGTVMQTAPEINHINNIPSDNVYTNLEWCDRYYNNAHRRDSKTWVYEKRTKAEGRAKTRHSADMMLKMIDTRENEIKYLVEMNNKLLDGSHILCEKHSQAFIDKKIAKNKSEIIKLEQELQELRSSITV